MKWIERLNEVICYIEDHLTSEISYTKAARLACCSVFHLQRMFSYMTDMSLSEYIRRRKMTLAALDLQKNETKIVEIALKYGYQSPTAFNRAFQNVHGIAPSEAKKDGSNLKAYPPLSFQITIKGVEKMEYRIEKKEAFRIVGLKTPLSKVHEENLASVPIFWDEISRDGRLQKIISKMSAENPGVLGVNFCTEDSWNYYVAVRSEQPLEDGLEECEIPASMWAIFSGKGAMPKAIQALARRVYTEWLPNTEYEYANTPDLEMYLDATPQNANFEIWLPIIRKLK